MDEDTSHPMEKPAPSAPTGVTLHGLVNRLKLPRASARRIAIIDLCQRPEPEAMEALLNHLSREVDQAARIRIIERLGSVRYLPALAHLRALAEDPGTAVEVAHAALIGADRIERGCSDPQSCLPTRN